MVNDYTLSDVADTCRAKIANVEINLTQDMRDAIRADGKIAICERLDEFYSPGTIENYRFNLLKRMPEKYNEILDQYMPITEADFTTFQIMTEKTLASNGLKQISKDHIRTIYDLIVNSHEIDPFYEYIKNIQWDGIPRLRRWFIDGLGAHIPSLSAEESDFLIEETTQAWFMGAIKRSQYM